MAVAALRTLQFVEISAGAIIQSKYHVRINQALFACRCATVSVLMSFSLSPPYSVSNSSSLNAFEKLQGINNYADWRGNMETMLLTLRQWGMVALMGP